MSAAAPAVSSAHPFAGTIRSMAASWRSLSARHFAYAALAGLFLGVLQAIGGTMILGAVVWSDALTGVALQVLLAVLLLLALAVAADVPRRRLPMWLPFVLAAVGVSALGSALNLLLYAIVSTDTLPPRLLAIGVARMFVIFAIPFTLAALGYWRGLDAWRRATALRNMQLQRIRLSRKAYESRLQALQARVDPRFLFDTLASIETTYEADASRGERMIDDLIAYLRAALPTLEEVASTLAAEISLVRAWLDLMSVRHGERLTFSIAVSDPEREARMPPMVLQPLVQHAVEAIVEGAFAQPHVTIAVTHAEDRLRIAMTATGSAFSDAAETPATRAIRERLEALYGADASLTFHWVNRDESRADLEIPYEHADRNHR
jgi:hypothetical protein